MTKSGSQNVLVIGAHNDPTKFANKAIKLLEAHGHQAIAVNPNFKDVMGKRCYASAGEWARESGLHADTVTLYVRPELSNNIIEEIVELKPNRVIFNPGTENPKLQAALKLAKIPYVEDCTLVMLNSNSF